MRRSADGVTTRRSSGSGRSSSCSRKIDWIADEHGGLQRPSKRFKAEERKRTAECLSHKTGNSVKRRNTWSQDEDAILIQMVGPHCKNKWSNVARSIPGRSREQCRERWMFYLDPAMNNQPWSEQEDITLIRAHRILGNKWCKLATHFPGRTGKAIKNRWHTLMNGKRNSDYIRGLTIDNKFFGTIKSGQDSCINIQVAVDCPIRPKPEQGFTEDGRNAALKKKGSDSMYSERYVSVNVSERQIARSSLPVVTKEKEALPSSSVVQKVSCVAENFDTSLQKKESTNCLEAPLNGVDAGFYPARDHVSIHDHFDDICSSANPESPELHLANIAALLDMSYCDSLMIVPPDSPNDGNSMEGTGH
ncbi:transcription factor MYB3R-2-like [Miscanthus floridulus]|uniref:transcription factor MYB3R-2-like n=1 Tax=Miscanthus floridulus TaxID=154761 RepID=UPI00345B2B46